MRIKRVFRILAALPLASASGRKILNGMHRFLGEGYDWDIELVRRDSEFLQLFDEGRNYSDFDGMIVAYAESLELRRKQAAIDLPTVFVDHPDPIRAQIRRRAFVCDDENSIAAAAVRHLLACGERVAYGYVPTREPTFWSQRRQQAFAEKLKMSGKDVAVFTDNGMSRKTLSEWLQRLDKPAAVLAAFDDRALDVLEACRAVQLDVPADVAVLGIGNDESICETTVPPLSSVAVDFETQGYRAARELQALLLGGANPAKCIRFGATETVRRNSTPGSIPSALLVQRAMDYIRAHALSGISSCDVAAHLRVSRRLADLRFRAVRGQSILEAILEIRTNEVKRLLSETDLSFTEIAERCGYRNSDVLRILFKRQTGLSLRDWRKGRPTPRGLQKRRE